MESLAGLHCHPSRHPPRGATSLSLLWADAQLPGWHPCTHKLNQPLPVHLPPCSSTSAEARLREAVDHGDVASAALQVRHLGKALHSAPLTKPSRLLCGMAATGGYLHLMFVYQGHDTQAYDDNFSLGYKLPVMETGDDFV